MIIPFPSKDTHICYMLPSVIRCGFQKNKSINLKILSTSPNINNDLLQIYKHTSRFFVSSSVSSTSMSSFLRWIFSSAVKKSSSSCFPIPNFGSLIPDFIGSMIPEHKTQKLLLKLQHHRWSKHPTEIHLIDVSHIIQTKGKW
jgi:hypothetical protein